MHTLISFLGKNKNKITGYNKTNYKIGNQILTTAFLGVELAKFIQPQKLLLIGTSGSMWDVFFEHHQTDDEQVLALIDAVSQNEVTEELLTACTPIIEVALGCQVKCIVMKYARNEQEQVELLNQIARELNKDDTISLDVTHSFRHLPMLALVASRFFKNVKNIQTNKIYYGALEMTENNEAPVIELNGLLKMLDWVDALSVYNHNGNYQVFSPLFERENGHKQAKLLEEAAFFENTNQIHNAYLPLKKFRDLLPELESPFMQLFGKELENRTKWVVGRDLGDHQLKMAKFYLKKGDYLRASVLAQEAWISKMVTCSDKGDFNKRKEAQKSFEKNASIFDKQLFDELKAIRNALAHGTKTNFKQVKTALADESKLHKTLKEILQHIK